MNDVILNLLKEKPVIIPKILFQNYRNLNIDEEEFILLICLINMGDKVVYNPSIFKKEIGYDKYKAMQILNNLFEKGLINIKVENNKSGKKEEYIYLDFLYLKLLNLLANDSNSEEKIEAKENNIFNLFEQELGRTISPMEVEIIKEWLHDGHNEELIKEALKEAIYQDARNLKYIDRILFNWKNEGIKNMNDLLKYKKNYRKPKNKTVEPIYDYNWLEDESNE